MQRVTFFEQFRNKDELAQYVKKNVGGSVGDFLKENLPLEKEFQKDIFEALRSWKAKGLINRNSLIWKEGSGVYQRAGLPDVCAIIDGHYFGFEVKRPFIGTVSGIQKKTIEIINAAGGTARVVCYASEVQKIIQDAGYWATSKKPMTFCMECEYWDHGICHLLGCDIGTECLDGCTLGKRKE